MPPGQLLTTAPAARLLAANRLAVEFGKVISLQSSTSRQVTRLLTDPYQALAT